MINKRFGMVYAIVICIFIIVIMALINGKVMQNVNYSFLEYGWDIEVNGEKFEDIKLSHFSFHDLKRGDMVVLSNSLPKDMKNGCVMYLETQNCTLDVFFQDRNHMHSIESYGHQNFSNKQFIGNTISSLYFPLMANGKRFEIILRANMDKPFLHIMTPKICDEKYATAYFFRERFLNSTVGGFLIFFGVVLICLAVLLAYFIPEMVHMVYIALFIILESVWSLNSNYSLVALFSNVGVSTLAEYLSLYTCMIPVMLYMYFRQAKEKKSRRLLFAEIIFNIAFIVTCIVLHMMGAVYIVSTLKIEHVIMVSNAAIMLYCLMVNYQYFIAKHLTVSSTITIVVFGTMDLLNYIISHERGYSFNSILSVGVLLFVVQWLIGFLYEVHINYIAYSKQEVLTKMAYEDFLTGLDNRAVVEECFDDLENNKTPYGVVSYDLNCLKKVNDTYGHEAGDEYIVNFSKLLKSFWINYGSISRVGGDEFLVIVPNRAPELVRALADDFENHVKKCMEEQKENQMNIRFSYGVAFSDEENCSSSKEVRNLADTRMYEMKRKFHMQMSKEKEES